MASGTSYHAQCRWSPPYDTEMSPAPALAEEILGRRCQSRRGLLHIHTTSRIKIRDMSNTSSHNGAYSTSSSLKSTFTSRYLATQSFHTRSLPALIHNIDPQRTKAHTPSLKHQASLRRSLDPRPRPAKTVHSMLCSPDLGQVIQRNIPQRLTSAAGFEQDKYKRPVLGPDLTSLTYNGSSQ